jgi:hypothetical protein
LATCFRGPTSNRAASATLPDCADTAHLANDSFRDLDGLGADDSYGDAAIAPVLRAWLPEPDDRDCRARMGVSARAAAFVRTQQRL